MKAHKDGWNHLEQLRDISVLSRPQPPEKSEENEWPVPTLKTNQQKGGGECEQSSEWSEKWTWGYVSDVLVQRSEVENPVR